MRHRGFQFYKLLLLSVKRFVDTKHSNKVKLMFYCDFFFLSCGNRLGFFFQPIHIDQYLMSLSLKSIKRSICISYLFSLQYMNNILFLFTLSFNTYLFSTFYQIIISCGHRLVLDRFSIFYWAYLSNFSEDGVSSA